MKSLSIILPCAGEGTRLGLPGPKELHEVYPGKRLIDYSLEHIRAFIRYGLAGSGIDTIQAVTVIRPGKEPVYEHVKEKLPDIGVNAVMFDPEFREWPGSVYSASRSFSDCNVVLLPDTFIKFGPDDLIYTDAQGCTLIGRAVEVLGVSGSVFGIVNCDDPDRLGALGAVRVEGRKILLFEDKPGKNRSRFNGFWGVYGFRREKGRALYEFLIDSVEKTGAGQHRLSELDPGVFFIDTYHDLGTADSLEKFRKNKKD